MKKRIAVGLILGMASLLGACGSTPEGPENGPGNGSGPQGQSTQRQPISAEDVRSDYNSYILNAKGSNLADCTEVKKRTEKLGELRTKYNASAAFSYSFETSYTYPSTTYAPARTIISSKTVTQSQVVNEIDAAVKALEAEKCNQTPSCMDLRKLTREMGKSAEAVEQSAKIGVIPSITEMCKLYKELDQFYKTYQVQPASELSCSDMDSNGKSLSVDEISKKLTSSSSLSPSVVTSGIATLNCP